MYLSLYCKGSKRVTQPLLWEEVGDRTELQVVGDRTELQLWPSALCLSRSPGLLNRRPRGQLSAGWWLSLLHLITNWYPKLHRGSWGLLRPRVAFPTTSCLRRLWSTTHLVSKSPLRRAFSTTSYQQLLWTPTHWLPVFTKLYNSSTSTQPPTQSLEWHV